LGENIPCKSARSYSFCQSVDNEKIRLVDLY